MLDKRTCGLENIVHICKDAYCKMHAKNLNARLGCKTTCMDCVQKFRSARLIRSAAGKQTNERRCRRWFAHCVQCSRAGHCAECFGFVEDAIVSVTAFFHSSRAGHCVRRSRSPPSSTAPELGTASEGIDELGNPLLVNIMEDIIPFPLWQLLQRFDLLCADLENLGAIELEIP